MSNVGTARAVVLLCAFGLATVGAFTAFFATEVLAVLFKADSRPGVGLVIACALIPVFSGVAAVLLAVRARSAGAVLALGFGVLVLGTMVTAALVLVAAV
jgi:hypothetical protein